MAGQPMKIALFTVNGEAVNEVEQRIHDAIRAPSKQDAVNAAVACLHVASHLFAFVGNISEERWRAMLAERAIPTWVQFCAIEFAKISAGDAGVTGPEGAAHA